MNLLIFLTILPFLLFLSKAENSPLDCSKDDLQLTVTCRPKLAKLTDEMKKNPLNSGFPSVETLNKMSGYCKEAMSCVSPAKCPAITEKMSKFATMCKTIDFMSGPYAQCAAKVR